MSNLTENAALEPAPRVAWWRRIGPGLITACVVIGPGSILTSSQVGAKFGYQMAWVVAAAVVFMMVYMTLGAKLGVVASQSAGTLVAERAGRWLAALIGLGVFFIAASFQFGNNLGVDSALKLYIDAEYLGLLYVNDAGRSPGRFFFNMDYAVVIFNAIAIAFLYSFKNLYKAIERLMMAFVALMLVAFALNLAFAKPDLVELAQGFVPPFGAMFSGQTDLLSLSLLGLVGTTFVVPAAYYQSYLVQQKGWGRADLRNGLIDARIGSIIMAVITLMIMATAGAFLRGQTLEGAGDVARGLEPLFGQWGQVLFCLGLFSAAYSSFLVNSMIGGFILADGLGLGSKAEDFWPRLFTTAALLIGMGVAIAVIRDGQRPVAAIVAAQAVTVVAAPLMAGALLWLTNCRSIMGDMRNGLALNLLAGIGFVLLLGMAYYTATEKVWPAVSSALSAS